MIREILPLLALLVASVPLQAQNQTVTVTGKVTDAATGRAVRGAVVRIFNSTVGGSSNDSGVYSFTWRRTSLRDTTIELESRAVQYQPQRRAVRVSGARVTADFSLSVMPAAVTSTDAVALRGGRGVAATAAGGMGRGGGGGGGGRGGAAAVTTGSAGLVAQQGQQRQQAEQRQQQAMSDAQRAQMLCPPAGCPNTESYDRIIDNPFLATASNALSTFSIDVDRASYANVRRFVTQGQRPPKDAVRIEEMINYFTYNYPAPANNAAHPFAVSTEVAAAPWSRQHLLVRIGLQAKKIETANLPPNNLVFLIDVSGSMAPANRLPLVKSSLRLLVEQLREQDHVSIVVYAGAAGMVLEPTSGANKARIFDALERLNAGGSTAGGAGLRLAYSVARHYFVTEGNNRVILATDGDFNVGVSSDAEMERLIEEERKTGVFLTVLGYGMGNLKNTKLELLAGKGNGNYAYIDDIAEARKTLVREMGSTLHTIAKDVKLQVEFNPSRVQAYRLIGYENRLLRAEDFNNDQKDAGELGAGHSVTALYEVIPVGVRSSTPIRGIDSLRYQATPTQTAAAASDELLFVKLRYKEPTGDISKLLSHSVPNRAATPSADFTFAAAVAAFGMILRDSEYKGNATVEDVISITSRNMSNDPHGYKADFLSLVRAYERLGGRD